MHSFILGQPSYYRIEACCPVTVLRIPPRDFWDLCRKNNDVAVWQLNLAYGQLAFFEHINSTVQRGSARERYMSMVTNRPEVVANVSLKTLASYLGVTQEYLSRLRKKLKKEGLLT